MHNSQYNNYYNIICLCPAGPAPAPAKGTSAALIVKEKENPAEDKWDARFSNFMKSTVTIQVSQHIQHTLYEASITC